MRILDLGCGPGSITAGLDEHGVAIGVDLDPGPPPASVSLLAGDATRLPFPDSSFDAVFSCAMLQHLPDPAAAVIEIRRVSRPGAVIGLADADWRGSVRVPDNDALARADEILMALRAGTSPYVGAELRSLLAAAGFERVTAVARGQGGGEASRSAGYAHFQASFFEAPEVVDVAVERGVATSDEMAAAARAWRAWANEPGAVNTGWWFEALGWAPT